jgi:hypothetical protein
VSTGLSTGSWLEGLATGAAVLSAVKDLMDG